MLLTQRLISMPSVLANFLKQTEAFYPIRKGEMLVFAYSVKCLQPSTMFPGSFVLVVKGVSSLNPETEQEFRISAVKAIQTHLKRLQPEEGDIIRLTYQGEKMSPTNQKFKSYFLEIADSPAAAEEYESTVPPAAPAPTPAPKAAPTPVKPVKKITIQKEP